MSFKTSPSGDIVPLIVADVFELAGEFRADGETIANTVGQTQARWQVLSAASGGLFTVPQIARRLGVTRQGVQRLANLLVAEGTAEFQDNPDHRASPRLVPTARGQQTLARLTRAAETYHRSLAARLSAGELRAVHQGLRQLLHALGSSDREWTRPSVRE